jgi:hypothetical protein
MQTQTSLQISYFTGKIIWIMGNTSYSNYTPLTVGSSPYTSSPTVASNIALRISAVGFDTVSLLKSTTRIWKTIQCVPKSQFLRHIKHVKSVTNTVWLMLFREVNDIVRIMKGTQTRCRQNAEFA